MSTTQQNVPVLRFKDEQGNDYLEWEEKRLGEICSTFKSGNGITMSRIAAKGNYPVYGGNGLRGYTDSFTHEGYFILIGKQGALCGNINRSNGKAYVSEHAIAVQANNGNDTEWLAQKLDIYNLNRLSESSAQPGLSVSKLGVCAVGRLAPRKTGDVLPKVQPGIPDGISGNGRFQIPASARFSIVRVRVLSRFPGINPPVAFASA